MTRYRAGIFDPPWDYSCRNRNGTCDRVYKTLTVDDLAALAVDDIMTDDAVIAVWATWQFLHEALHLIETWGFVYVTALPYIKVIGQPITGSSTWKVAYGTGYWLRGCSEVVLIARRPGVKAPRSSYVGILSERFTHSRKPDSLHEYMEQTFDGPFLELFARRERPGWTCLGNEVDGRDIRDSLANLIEEDHRD